MVKFMKYSRILLHFYFSVMILAGCTTKAYLDRAIIRNETGGVISDVRVRHEPSGKIGEVHSILARSQFEIGFAEQRMQATRSYVTWRNQTGQEQSVELALPPAGQSAGDQGPAILLYTIYPESRVTVELKK